MSDSIDVFKCLADGSRLRIMQGLMKGPMYVELIASRLGLSPSTVSIHLKKLENAGLVSSAREQYYTIYAINTALMDKTLTELITPNSDELSPEEQRENQYRSKVISSFFEYGKLKTIPAQRKKRLIILEEIVSHFDFDREYPEREVNLIISEMHDDFCTLRREMIADGLMTRDHGIYKRVKKQ